MSPTRAQVAPKMAAVQSEYKYRRHLPHMQGRGGALFVTFCTFRRWHLPDQCREIALEHCRFGDPSQYALHAAVVMPDHVHLILTPAIVGNADVPLKAIMNSIKGSSAHAINKALSRSGPVWQNERFDHVLRSNEAIFGRILYVANNPVRRGLVKDWRDYRWTWVAKYVEI